MSRLPGDGQHPDLMEAIAAIPGAAAGWAGSDWEQQEWVPYGHHLHCRVGFFPFEKYASLLALVPARLHNWNSRAACRLRRKEGAPWLPFYKMQLYNRIGS